MKLESIRCAKINDFKKEKLDNLANILGGFWSKTTLNDGTKDAWEYELTSKPSGVIARDFACPVYDEARTHILFYTC